MLLTAARRRLPAGLARAAVAWACLAWATSPWAESDEVRIGVLAHRSAEDTARHWAATAAHLESAVPGHRFRILAMSNVEMDRAVETGAVDFVLTQPEQYVMLRARHGLAAIATLMPLAEGWPVAQFGGVIFARADRADLTRLEDVRGKRIAAVYEHSLGAYRAQQWTLLKAGVELPWDAGRLEFTGQPQDRTVEAVLDGQADVGFVRTGVLEAMAREGKLSLDGIRVINAQPAAKFPERLSTDLFPEWPLAALGSTGEPLVKAVALALLNIAPDSDAAREGDYYGFSPPGDYAPLEAVLLRLRVHPDRLEHFDVRDVAHKYAQPITAGLLGLLALAGLVVLGLVRANRRIRQASAERALLLGSLGEGVYGVNRDGRCTFANPAALAMLGFEERELVGADQHRLFHHHRADGRDYAASECPVHRTLADGARREAEDWFFRKDGSGFPVHLLVTALRQGAEITGAVVAFQDVTERQRIEADLRVAAVAFETQEAILITGADNRIVRVNKAFCAVTGYDAEEVLGRTPGLLKSGRHDAAFYREMWAALDRDGHWQGEIWNRRKNGEEYPEWLTITAVRGADGAVCHYVAAFLDMTARKRAEEQIEYMALYDPLTDLPNRRLLRERLGRAVAASHRSQRHGALLFIDLDNFKTLNDTQGHDTGDRMLVEAARRLRSSVRDSDTVARLGGDEFVVMLENFAGSVDEAATQVEAIGEEILDSLGRPYHLGDGEHHSSASIGIALFRDQDSGIDDLLKRADLAMYQAKAAGRNTLRFFDPDMQATVVRRAALEADLRRALKAGEFLLHYQPQVDSRGRVLGAEALLRWEHPARGTIPPSDFVPLAEASGLIVPLGQWVLEAACAQLAAWRGDPATAHVVLAVNVSARQFRQPDFVGRVQAALAMHGLAGSASRLELELTESLLLEGVEEAIGTMKALKALGVGFSLDDFGTGYSSLAYLKRLPLDQLKIDKSFVRDVLTDDNDAAIARTVLALGRTLGLKVIAEGVESEGQRDFLVANGCHAFQGYLFGRPMPPEAFAALCRSPSGGFGGDGEEGMETAAS